MEEEQKDTHWSKLSEASKKRYNKWKLNFLKEKKARGECYRCSDQAVPGGIYCPEHKAKQSEERKAAYVKGSGNKTHKVRLSQGLCKLCGLVPHREDRQTCQECADATNQTKSKWNASNKAKVIAAYGGACVCCGETYHMFLSLDHVNNDGGEHGREKGSISYSAVINEGYPDTLQLLCHTCNMAKNLNGGVCPHQSCTLGGGFVKTEPYLPVCVNPRNVGT